MADHTHNALASMSYALQNVVAPAVDPADPIASEQLQSAVRYLDFALQRIDLLPEFHRAELRQHLALATTLCPLVPALERELSVALDDAMSVARSRLSAVKTSIGALRSVTATLAGLLSEMVRLSDTHGDDQLRASVGHAVVAASRQRTLLERAWYLPLGFDQSPGEIPPLELLLDIAVYEDETAAP